jgi:hypothetical protein
MLLLTGRPYRIITVSIKTLGIMTFSIMILNAYDKCLYAECHN